MGTRASIIIRDEQDTLFFYRHSDGYPECTGADLTAFVADYTSNALRDNASQSAGWLIVRGHFEYRHPASKPYASADETGSRPILGRGNGTEWKVGAYEPTTCLHGDVEYVYIIDLKTRTLTCRVPTDGFWDTPSLLATKASRKFKMVRF